LLITPGGTGTLPACHPGAASRWGCRPLPLTAP